VRNKLVVSGLISLGLLFGCSNESEELKKDAEAEKAATYEIVQVEEKLQAGSLFKDSDKVFNDEYIQELIHGMTHQKVNAHPKWNSILMTEERIKELDEAIELAGEAHLEHYDIYREIVNKWLDNDFSTIDEDHNRIWKLQGGTIGKANGVLSKQEELKFIQNNFE